MISHPFITIFVSTKVNDFISCVMEELIYITTLVKTYRRLFNCLMFYN